MTSDSTSSVPSGRALVFYGAVVVAIGLAVVGLGEFMTLAVLGWLDGATLDDLYAGAAMHRMHVLGQALFAWLVAIGILIQPFRTPRTLAAAIVALIALVADTGAAVVGGVFDPLAALGIVALGLIVWARPGRAVARVLPLERRVLLFGVPLFVGSLTLAFQQIGAQLSSTPGEVHAALGHYGLTAAMAISLGAAAVIGSSSLPGRTLAAWLTVGGTLYYGVASIMFPAEASSLGIAGGATAMLAAAIYAFGVVTSGRTAPAPATPEPQAQPLR